MRYISSLLLALIITIAPSLALAEETTAAISETSFLFNTFLLLFCGILVMFMSAGFAMLEAGMVRSKSVAVILTKNIALYAISGVMFYLVGYHLMYTGVDGGFMGTLMIWAEEPVTNAIAEGMKYTASADWFFQMVFVATAASIVSGALAERIKLWPFFIFTMVLTAVIYPITGSWKWGGGWLENYGFLDFAGSTLVHSVGGWAALAGVIMLGARRGRFDEHGNSIPIPGSSLPQVTLGTFILWMGWFGFNSGSHLAFGSIADAISVSRVLVNTNAAAAGGVVAVMIASQIIYKRIDLPLVLNGALAGLVSITAEPLMPSVGQAIIIGACGGIIMAACTQFLEYLKIDDVVGAIPVHLAGGIWGTLAVTFSNPDASLTVQLVGIAAVAAFVFTASMACWYLLKTTVGIRLHWSKEDMGGDLAEIGMRAYNLDFGGEQTK